MILELPDDHPLIHVISSATKGDPGSMVLLGIDVWNSQRDHRIHRAYIVDSGTLRADQHTLELTLTDVEDRLAELGRLVFGTD